MGFDPQRSDASYETDAWEQFLARQWREFEGKRYNHACRSCDASKMCRCNPGKAIIRSILASHCVAADVRLTAKQQWALNGGTKKPEMTETSTTENPIHGEDEGGTSENEEADVSEENKVDERDIEQLTWKINRCAACLVKGSAMYFIDKDGLLRKLC
ncbi:hypothetical protein E8E11_001385 [Didymella keratinophila]|nr:hypothetical protein E8E11_001385 [Didymella keratinophila]